MVYEVASSKSRIASMRYENILVETRGRVGIIRLNRPQALNALNSALNAELGRAIAAFDADAGIGCMLLTGSEKAFAAGADIKEMADKTAVAMVMGDFAATWHAAAAVAASLRCSATSSSRPTWLNSASPR